MILRNWDSIASGTVFYFQDGSLTETIWGGGNATSAYEFFHSHGGKGSGLVPITKGGYRISGGAELWFWEYFFSHFISANANASTPPSFTSFFNETVTSFDADFGDNAQSNGIPETGVKFYNEQGELLYNTNLSGNPNQVYVISEKNMKSYNYYVNADTRHLHNNDYFKDVGSTFGREYSIRIYDDCFIGFGEQDPWFNLYGALMVGQAFVQGYARSPRLNINKGLLEGHYDLIMNNNILGYDKLLEHNSSKRFQPWW